MRPNKAKDKIIAYSTSQAFQDIIGESDFDIIDEVKGIAKNTLNQGHFNKGGVYHNFKFWMNKNAESFGFYEVYTNAKDRIGLKYEP